MTRKMRECIAILLLTTGLLGCSTTATAAEGHMSPATNSVSVVSVNTGSARNALSSIKFAMGPKRPYQPREEVLVVIRAAVADVLGTEATVHVTSGSNIDHVHHKGPDLPRHGSRRHGTGYAADVSFYDAAGKKVTDKATIEAILIAAARHGAKGFGWGGAEYMGWDCVHIDLLEPQGRESNFWKRGALGISGKLTEAMNLYAKNRTNAKGR